MAQKSRPIQTAAAGTIRFSPWEFWCPALCAAVLFLESVRVAVLLRTIRSGTATMMGYVTTRGFPSAFGIFSNQAVRLRAPELDDVLPGRRVWLSRNCSKRNTLYHGVIFQGSGKKLSTRSWSMFEGLPFDVYSTVADLPLFLRVIHPHPSRQDCIVACVHFRFASIHQFTDVVYLVSLYRSHHVALSRPNPLG